MISKIITTALAIVIVMLADCAEAKVTEQATTIPEPTTIENYPDNEKIKADLMGHSIYITGGFPAFWQFSFPSTIQVGNINTTRRKGDLLEFNYTLFLVDYTTKEQSRYRVETVVAYKQVAGDWELFTVQGNAIKKLEGTNFTMPNYLQDGC